MQTRCDSGHRKPKANTVNQNNIMKAKVIFLALALGASTGLRAAQDGNPSRDAQRPAPPAGGPGVPAGGDRPGQTETLTDAPQAQVKGILAKYDASTLTAD
jgi:hypothetical protein